MATMKPRTTLYCCAMGRVGVPPRARRPRPRIWDTASPVRPVRPVRPVNRVPGSLIPARRPEFRVPFTFFRFFCFRSVLRHLALDVQMDDCIQ